MTATLQPPKSTCAKCDSHLHTHIHTDRPDGRKKLVGVVSESVFFVAGGCVVFDVGVCGVVVCDIIIRATHPLPPPVVGNRTLPLLCAPVA